MKSEKCFIEDHQKSQIISLFKKFMTLIVEINQVFFENDIILKNMHQLAFIVLNLVTIKFHATRFHNNSQKIFQKKHKS